MNARGTATRSAALVLAAMLLAACGSAAPTTRPAATSTATLPTITLAPTATPVPATEGPPTCSPDGSPTAGTFDVRTIEGTESIELGPVDALPTPEPPASGPPPSLDPDLPVTATVLGGTDVVGRLTIDSFDGDYATITSLSAQFLPATGGPPIEVPTTFGVSEATLRLPDADITGTLQAVLQWSTLCGPREGAGAILIEVLDSSIAAGCPTSEDGLLAAAQALQPSKVAYDALQVPLGIVGWSGRWIAADAVDDFPQFSGWDQDAGLVVAPGASIVLRESVGDLQLLSVRAGIYLRDEVEAYIEPGSSTELNVFDVQRRTAGPLGRIGIPAPLEPGRYVFEVQGEAQTSCLNLDTYQVISVDVR